MLQNDGQTSNHHHHLHSHHQTLSLFFFFSFVRSHTCFSVCSKQVFTVKSLSLTRAKAHRSSLTMLISFLTFSFVVSLRLSREATHLFPILLFAYNQPSMLAKTSETTFVYLVKYRIPLFFFFFLPQIIGLCMSMLMPFNLPFFNKYY